MGSRGVRCFYCGNFYPIKQKKLFDKFATENLMEIHARLYPTCGWVQQHFDEAYILQIFQQRFLISHTTNNSYKSSDSIPLANYEFPTLKHNRINDEYDSDRLYESLSDEEFASVARPRSALPFKKSNRLQSLVKLHGTIDADQNSNFGSVIHSVSVNSTEAYSKEINRFETFKRLGRSKFASFEVTSLAYAGFYLRTDEDMIACPWCHIKLEERDIEQLIQNSPNIYFEQLSAEDWTPMLLHRKFNLDRLSSENPYCALVFRCANVENPNTVSVSMPS